MRNFFLLLFFTLTMSLHAQRSDFNEIDFQKAEKIANRYKGEELYNLPFLTYKLTSSLETEVEQFKAIYYWVTHNISGDYDLMYKNDRQRHKLKNNPEALQQWNTQIRRQIFNRLLSKKETLCTGYAYLIQELASIAGLECVIINGNDVANKVKLADLDSPNHSWNAVKLDGKWYLCDATWSSGYIDMSTFLFEFKYDETFFLMEPAEFAESHKPTDEKWTLLNENLEN